MKMGANDFQERLAEKVKRIRLRASQAATAYSNVEVRVYYQGEHCLFQRVIHLLKHNRAHNLDLQGIVL